MTLEKTYSALIIDDEPPARNMVRSFLSGYPNISIAEECGNGFEALKAIQEHHPDLLFLDVQMPKVTGLELLEVLDHVPVVIFSTAYEQYALKAFEMSAVDYLLKPYSRERFNQAMEKALEQLETGKHTNSREILENHSEASPSRLERIVVKTGNKMHVIPVSEIHFLEASEDYVMVHTGKGRHLKAQTMKHYENHLNPSQFVRIHRSYIVNITYIERIEPYDKDSYIAITTERKRLKISRTGYRKLKETLNF
jgi:two-component system LytT family response regulator